MRRHDIWLVPSLFVVSMGIGTVWGTGNQVSGLAEHMVTLSVVSLGLAVAAGRRWAYGVTYAGVCTFGYCHGYTHGVRIVDQPAGTYVAGILAVTALLHLFGVAAAVLMAETSQGHRRIQVLGAAVAVAGVTMLFTGA